MCIKRFIVSFISIFFTVFFCSYLAWAEQAAQPAQVSGQKIVVVKTTATHKSRAPKSHALPTMLDINTATVDQLHAIGIGKKAAAAIIRARQAEPTGKFATMDDLKKLKGVSYKKIESLINKQALTIVS